MHIDTVVDKGRNCRFESHFSVVVFFLEITTTQDTEPDLWLAVGLPVVSIVALGVVISCCIM